MSEEQKLWNGKYPIFIEPRESDKPAVHKATCNFQECVFIEEECELIELCRECHIDPRTLTYYEALPVYAHEGVSICTDELEYEGELDEEIQQLIDEFQQKLRAIKRPIVYYPSCGSIMMPKYQLEEWCVKGGKF